jgi:glutaminyl-peptide cyclotransferase
MRFYILILSVFLMSFCSGSSNENTNVNQPPTNTTTNGSAVPVYDYEIVREYRHDPDAFTQGLVFHNGFLYEGTGGDKTDYFDSSLRKVELDTGKVVQQHDLADEHFGEGIVIHNDKIYQLTWRSGICFVYNLADFKPVGQFRYNGEGWGLTTDGTDFFMTDGSQIIQVLDPETFEKKRSIVVNDEDGKPVFRLNELEYVKGEIWANVWQTGKIARIDPADGKLLGWIDLGRLAADQERKSRKVDVLNGIAYDAAGDRLFVTGKMWRNLYEIKLKPAQ